MLNTYVVLLRLQVAGARLVSPVSEAPCPIPTPSTAHYQRPAHSSELPGYLTLCDSNHPYDFEKAIDKKHVMASASARFIAQSSKLGLNSCATPTFRTRLHGTLHSNHVSLLSSRSPVTRTTSIRTCSIPQYGSLDGVRPFSLAARQCSSTDVLPRQATIDWPTSRPSKYVCEIVSKRFASGQPQSTEKDEASATSSSAPTREAANTNIIAPQILKQALVTPHENIYTLPNFLTFTRLLSAPAIGYFILTSQPLAALSLFFYAGVTDLVDGYLARRFNSQTVVGTVIDPMADKTLMTVAVICLAVQSQIPIWLAVVILGRDVGLAISACYYRYISLPPPKTFARYWDFSLPSAEVRPTEISKINTLLQLLLVGTAMVLPVLPAAWVVGAANLQGVFEGWQILVATTTVWSGLSYVFSKDAVKILNQSKDQDQDQDQNQ